MRRAYLLAVSAHCGPGAGDTGIEHPVAVAALLAERGLDAELVAAALLHDAVEDTPLRLEEIRERCGEGVAALVGALTEDSSIAAYSERKAEHRARVAAAGERAATVYAADKVAKLRAAREAKREPGRAQREHFEAVLRELRARYPSLAFLDELEAELDLLAPARRG